MTNRLEHESSPYLLQHAENPVDWYPWGKEALRKAQAEDKPIFLSIGYSACHWCHVMARESFEDERVAAILNDNFVSIKVDREERPDLDRIYIGALQALTGRAGWPLSVFLTPDGEPFYGGTYFPPTPRYGMPAFSDVLLAVADAWRTRRAELIAEGRNLVAVLRQRTSLSLARDANPLTPTALDRALQNLRRSFDHAYGGWNRAPKFPQPMVLEFLLRRHHATGDRRAMEMVTRTLEAMARGGMYDQIGGGFHRYSVDDRWHVPHFEKMLYDNAQLARVYLHAWQVTGNPLYRAIAEETLDYVRREMTAPEGGFYSTQDADSDGEEGRFYLWTVEEIRSLLGGEARRFLSTYEPVPFEGRAILTFRGGWAERESLAEARRRLFAARTKRTPPARDDKILTAWNGLMLAAFAEAARALDRDDYRRTAERNAAFILNTMRAADGRLYHTGTVGGYLEDYTHFCDGLLELYQTTFDPRWYVAASELVETMIDHFGAPDGGFFDTGDDHEALVVRPRELQDNAVPSGNGMATLVLLRLAGLAVTPRYQELAHRSLEPMQMPAARYPLGFGQWLIALDYGLSHPREIGIVGDPDVPDTRALLTVCSGYRPHQVLAVGTSDIPPLLQGRKPLAGRATAYVCVDFACRPPVTDPETLRVAIETFL